MAGLARYALVKKAAPRIVDNVCLWDGVAATWTPPADCDAIRTDVANIGDLYDPVAGTFTSQLAPADPLAADKQRLYNYMPTSGSAIAQTVTAYMADVTKDAATRATMAALRSVIRVLVSQDPNS